MIVQSQARSFADSFMWGFLIVFFVPTTLIVASWKAIPGDVFFPVKIVVEKSALFILSPSSLASGSLQIRYTERRLGEAQTLMAMKQSVTGLTYFEKQMEETKQAILQTSDPKIRGQLAREYAQSLTDISVVLAQQKKQILAQPNTPSVSNTANAPTQNNTANTGQTRQTTYTYTNPNTVNMQATGNGSGVPTPTPTPVRSTFSGAQEAPQPIVTPAYVAAPVNNTGSQPAAAPINSASNNPQPNNNPQPQPAPQKEQSAPPPPPPVNSAQTASTEPPPAPNTKINIVANEVKLSNIDMAQQISLTQKNVDTLISTMNQIESRPERNNHESQNEGNIGTKSKGEDTQKQNDNSQSNDSNDVGTMAF